MDTRSWCNDCCPLVVRDVAPRMPVDCMTKSEFIRKWYFVFLESSCLEKASQDLPPETIALLRHDITQLALFCV